MGDNAVAAPVQQPMRALERANRVRLARAELKREVAAGGREVSEVILSCPWQAEGMAISELLMSQRRWGRARCRRALLSLGLVENKPIGSLTERQRTMLAGVLSSSTSEPAPAPERRRGAVGAPA
jgi:hypothetical protein